MRHIGCSIEVYFDDREEVHMSSNTERPYNQRLLVVANQAINMAGNPYFKRRLLVDKPHCLSCVLIRLYVFAGKPAVPHEAGHFLGFLPHLGCVEITQSIEHSS